MLLPSIATNSPFWIVTDTLRSACNDTAFWQYIFEMFSPLNTSNFIYLLLLSKTVTSTASKANNTGSNTGQEDTAPASSSITTGTTYFRG